ncbi:MAG: carbohydrate porin, partial [Planctomycetota bacterium]|nr:carbohydrate porin [Planctomycetota bacterium]
KKQGLAFGLDYTAVYLKADNSPGEDEAAGGIFRFFGSWTLTGRGTDNTGSLVYKVENRHRLASIPPNALGFETGYLGFLGAPFGDQGWMLTNLYWQQRTRGERLNFVAGWIDATDYLNIYGLVSPWLHFLNLEFETGSTIPLPNQGLGAAVGAMLTDTLYLVAGLTDTNGDPTSPEDGFDTFFNDHEFFTHVEIGYTPSFERRYLDNVHLMLWHADERENAQVPDGWGANFSAAKFIDDKWMPFFRAGWSEDGGALLQASVTGGAGFYFKKNRDVLAFALGWGKPTDNALRDQYTAEIFYRFQIAQNLALTPSLQFVIDPALNPAEDEIIYFGLRLRFSL